MNGLIYSIVLAGLLGLSGWAWTSVVSRLEGVEITSGIHVQKITKLETENTSTRETLIRIDRKLDRIIERGNK